MVFSEHASNTLRTAVPAAFPAFAAALVAMLALASPAHAAVTTTTSGNTTTTSISYSGGVQTFTAPYNGTYTLEVWGAQGGSLSNLSNGASYTGGKGGKSSGTVSLRKGQTVYVVVGGQGISSTAAGQDLDGGYNGGGYVKGVTSVNHRNASGGGATHMAMSSGVLSSLENNQSSVLIVAGGGGGARWQANSTSANDYSSGARWGNGGAGGGLTGESVEQTAFGTWQDNETYSGTQSRAGGSRPQIYEAGGFGKAPAIYGNSSGGGGWYGGGSTCMGSGGSGYIGGVKNGSTSRGVQSGNGKAAITYSRAITVTYNANGGTMNPAAQYLGYGMAITKNTPVRSGYTFAGWSETQNGAVTIQPGDAITTSSSTPTLYAQWKPASSTETSGNVTSASFDFSNGIQTFTAPYTGTYTLEVWGAQGGSLPNMVDDLHEIYDFTGGLGGKSSGQVTLTEGQTIYIAVGGQGTGASGAGQDVEGGYNGGGFVMGNSEWNHMNASGGGATHISTRAGLLSSLSDQKSSVLIVAGGGGGARFQQNTANTSFDNVYARWGNGGAGGGLRGYGAQQTGYNTWIDNEEMAGTQERPGALIPLTTGDANANNQLATFGQGLSAYGNSGGGGGWYGGGGQRIGSGGSGYIGGVTDGITTTGVQSGNGKARITYNRAISITFNANGGSGGPTSQTLGYGDLLTTEIPTRDGYTFAGWTEQSGGGGFCAVPGEAVEISPSSTTVYAQWHKDVSASTPPLTLTSPGEIFSTLQHQWTKTYSDTAYAGYFTSNTKYAGVMLVGLTQNAVVKKRDDTSQSLHTQSTFDYKGRTWWVSGSNSFWKVNYPGAGVGVNRTDNDLPYMGQEITPAQAAREIVDWVTYEVEFDGNGADAGSMSSIYPIYDENVTLPSNSFSRFNFSFAGWNTEADGTGDSYDDTQSISGIAEKHSKVTLYAQWHFTEEVSGISETNPDEDGDGYGDNLAFSAPCDISAVVKPDGSLMFPSNSSVQNLSGYRIEISAIESSAEGEWVLMSSIPQDPSTNNALCVTLGIGSDDPVNLTAYSSKTSLSGQFLSSNATKSLVWSGHGANITGSSGDFASVTWYVRPAYE